MNTAKRVTLAALAALLLLAAATSVAAALRSLQSSSNIIELLAPALSFSEPNLGISVVCEVGATVTLNQNPIPKTARSRIGRVLFRVLNRENRCSGGRAFVVGGPFDVNYLGFTGELPEITGLLLETLRVVFLVEALGLITCQITAEALGFQAIERHILKELKGERGGLQFRLANVVLTRLARACSASSALSGKFNATRSVTIELL